MKLTPEILAEAERIFKNEIDTPQNDLKPDPARLAYQLRNLTVLVKTLAKIVMDNAANEEQKAAVANASAAVDPVPSVKKPEHADLAGELKALEEHAPHTAALLRAVNAKLFPGN